VPISTGLEGRWVLVTGGTEGIGRACVAELARAGANVVFFSRSADRAKNAAAKVLQEAKAAGHSSPTTVEGLACDVGRPGDVERAMRSVADLAHGELAAVVHTATYPVVAERWNTMLHEVPRSELQRWFDEVRAVDVEGARFVSYEALHLMVPRRHGSLVFFSSTPALVGYKGLPYTEAKAAILGLTRDLAKAYGPFGIRSNAIAPGNIRTSWLDPLTEEERRALEQENPLGRFGEPAEVARVAVFLASELSSFVNGQTIIADGGTELR
jgi:3-oxoacyl-[acyl-carrier protein] reductase